MSFRLKTVLGVALIELVLLATLMFSSLSTLRATSENAQASEAKLVTEMFARLAKDAVVSGKLAVLDSFALRLLMQNNVASVWVYDAGGKIMSEIGELRPARETGRESQVGSGADDGRLYVSADLKEGDKRLGRVEIGFSTAFIDSLVAAASHRLLQLAAAVLVLSAIFSFVLGTYLTRRLAELRDIASRITDGDVGIQMRVRGGDEVAQTALSINRMSAKLKETYQELSDREKRTRDILSNIVEAVITADTSGNIQSFNCAAGGLFGYRTEDIVGKPLAKLMASRELIEGEQPQDYLLARAQEREKLRVEHTGRRRDGSAFPMEVCISRVELENDTCFICVIRDLTHQKEEEKNWRLAHQVFANSGEAIVVTTPGRRVVAVNPAFAQLTGYAGDEFVGRLSSDLHIERMQPAKSIRIGVNALGRWDGEVWHRRKDGSEYPAWMTASRITDENGEATHYIYIFRDISEQKRIDQMKSEFVSTVSHELRTPLTVIKGSLDLINSGVFGALPDVARDLINKASQNSDRLEMLINDILDVEKIESGSADFAMQPLAVSGLLEEAVTAYGSYASDRGVHCAIVGAPIEARITADRSRLMQVLANIISNASKFSPDGEAIELSAQRCDAGIRISVRDHGPGIAKEFHERIFQKFAQADSSDARAQNGTGLGLSISKLIVEGHGGTIGLTTELGRGSTFHITLPEAADNMPECECAIEGPMLETGVA